MEIFHSSFQFSRHSPPYGGVSWRSYVKYLMLFWHGSPFAGVGGMRSPEAEDSPPRPSLAELASLSCFRADSSELSIALRVLRTKSQSSVSSEHLSARCDIRVLRCSQPVAAAVSLRSAFPHSASLFPVQSFSAIWCSSEAVPLHGTIGVTT